jgi:hypothetical protein
MPQREDLSQIIKYGLDNKKKQDEIMSAGIAAGFSPSQMEKELVSLGNSGVFESLDDSSTGLKSTKGGEFLKADQVTSLAEGDVALDALSKIEKTLSGREKILEVLLLADYLRGGKSEGLYNLNLKQQLRLLEAF